MRRLAKILLGVWGMTFLLFPLAFSKTLPLEGLPSFADLVEELKPVVVNISTTKVIRSPLEEYFRRQFKEFFGEDFRELLPPLPELRTQSLGSGFIIDKEGHILTNNHVIEGAQDIKIKLYNGKIFDAKVIGRDSKVDIALLKIDPKGEDLPVAKLGDSDKVRVGDWVIAIGNPFGLEHTVTAGIISAKGRVIGMGPYDDFLQTDASINPGNSGGPLFNLKGEVVGINTAIVAGGQGIGFAIPINMAKNLLPQLKKGRVYHAFLGVFLQDLTPGLARRLGLKEAKGALITDVIPNSPASKAGLRKGDVIVKFNDREVKDRYTLVKLIATSTPGQKVRLEIIRNGTPISVTVVLGKQEAAAELYEEKWGFEVKEMDLEFAKLKGIKEGVLVSKVYPNSPAQKAGLAIGDIIMEVEGEPVYDLNSFQALMEKYGTQSSLLLTVRSEKDNYRPFFLLLET